MCKEYFAHLDEDNDGFLVWEDFGAMRTLAADFEPELRWIESLSRVF